MLPQELFISTSSDATGVIIPNIGNSLRFRSAASAYLSRTPSAAGNRTTWTWSGWIKRGRLQSAGWDELFTAGTNNSSFMFSGDSLTYYESSDGTTPGVVNKITTTQVFRDVSAWYHIMLVVDTTQIVAFDRAKIYVNGQRITSFVSVIYATQNYQTYINNNIVHYIGYESLDIRYFDGYMADTYFIDGLALDPTYFGQIDPTSGQWSPKLYTGGYGTNGFHLTFSDASSVANLGLDSSGIGNNWTPTNFSLTVGSTYDSMYDSPTNNFASGNSLPPSTAITNAGLGTTSTFVGGTIRPSSGLWYYEVVVTSVANEGYTYPLILDSLNNQWFFQFSSTTTDVWKYYNSTPVAIAVAHNLVAGDVFMIAIDLNFGKLWAGINGLWFEGDPSIGTTPSYSNLTVGLTYTLGHYSFSGNGSSINYGQQPFVYTPPAGFNKLCSQNLPTPTVPRGETGFDLTTYTGNGANVQIGEYQFPRFSYHISNSLRFKGINSYLSRTPTIAGNQQIWSISMWVKPTSFVGAPALWYTGSSNTFFNQCYFDTNGRLNWFERTSGGAGSNGLLTTVQTFTEYSNFTHFVMVWDTTQANPADRMIIYVNGIRASVTWTTYPSQFYNGWFNSTVQHQIGILNGSEFFQGYLSEIIFIDGQALAPTSFGSFDINGYWIPESYTGTFGTNGFYLPFSDNSTLTTSSNIGLGKDFSGNGNYWTTNNISLTAGETYDSMTDSPTNNTFNIYQYKPLPSGTSIDMGALRVTNSSATVSGAFGGEPIPTKGKYYFEFILDSYSYGNINNFMAGAGIGSGDYSGNWIIVTCWFGSWVILLQYNGAQTTLNVGTIPTASDINGIAFDLDVGIFYVYKNNVLLGSMDFPFSSAENRVINFRDGTSNASVFSYNFGQRPLTYTPPTGFNTLTTPNIAEYTYDLESPDLVWIKSRSTATDHMIFDSVRGVSNYFNSNTANAQGTDVNSLIQFNKNGFYVGNNTTINTLNNAYIAWMWKANTPTVTNTNGSITSQVRANTSLGFSIVSYTGTGSNATVGHGLGIAPKFIIVKKLAGTSGSANSDPMVWHNALVGSETLYLDSSTAKSTLTNMWNSTIPTSTVFSLGNNILGNENTISHIAYCFTEIQGFSMFGSYTGNGAADGPFVYCGFKPKFIMLKRLDAAGDWTILDGIRNVYNVVGEIILPDTNVAAADQPNSYMDFTSNGFKFRATGTSGQNISGGTYIFAAFAECPIKYATAR